MSETTSAPAAKPAFFYVVVSPFLAHQKGDTIKDTATIADIEAHYLAHVVRIAATAA